MMASGWKEINNNLYYFQSWGGIYKNGFRASEETSIISGAGVVYIETRFFTVKEKPT